MKLAAIAAAALLALGCAPTVAGPAQPSLQLIDLTDDFTRIYDRDAKLPDEQRVSRFKQEFARLLPGFYDEKRLEVSAEKYDAHLLKQFKSFPEKRAGVERVSREFATSLAPALHSFEAEFGPMTGY